MLMLLLDVKDGKLWWKRPIGNGKYEFLSEEEMLKMKKEDQEIIDTIAARILYDAFKS